MPEQNHAVENLAQWLSGENRAGSGPPTTLCVTPLRLAKLKEEPWTAEEQFHLKNCTYCQRRVGGMFHSFCPAQAELEQLVAQSDEYFLTNPLRFHLGELNLGDGLRKPCPTCTQKVRELRAQQSR